HWIDGNNPAIGASGRAAGAGDHARQGQAGEEPGGGAAQWHGDPGVGRGASGPALQAGRKPRGRRRNSDASYAGCGKIAQFIARYGPACLPLARFCLRLAMRQGDPEALAWMADEFGHLPRGPRRMLMAAVWSMQGLRGAWLQEASFRLEVYLLAVLAPLA